ncbi:MAG TPA: D-glycero-beta-D-manno-heptose 1-phosphate adenylyltransferase [Phycisphaerales bacterium]|nr:D-glycero-beta-D-manno-heptose 1-phosphate adenylyltransferase [Phycisphaerales bacterium]
MDPLLGHLRDWKPFRSIVVGDFMLDQLLFGDAERLSADAPVPILLVREEQHRPGGAANVCLDLAELASHVCALGVVGRDPHADTLRRELNHRGIDTACLLSDQDRPTTVKQNLIGRAQTRHPQKMFRVDYESREPLSREVTGRLLDALRTQITGADVVCIEDYAKGVCTPDLCQGVIAIARAHGIPVMVDPAKLSDYSKYKGATVITPNRTEAEFATGLSTCGEATLERNEPVARRLMETLDLEAVVLTLDRHGALLLERGGSPVAVPTVARQVYDVTGAGDMFLAGLAAARANRCGWFDAVRFANAAAGLEVEIFGVEPIPLEKIHQSLIALSTREHGKLRTLEQLQIEVAAARRAGRTIVFTNGCFDVLHAGHVTLLDKAAAEGDFLIVALNDDASVRRLKGESRPVNHQEDRVRVLGALASVDAVTLFAEDTPIKLIEAVRPDVLVKGGDYTKDKVVGGAFVESYGGRVALVDVVEGRSTTNTLKRLRGS